MALKRDSAASPRRPRRLYPRRAITGLTPRRTGVGIGIHEGEVRDSKNPTGAALMFTATEWSAFTTGVRAGEFD
jgi:hypothetical protein